MRKRRASAWRTAAFWWIVTRPTVLAAGYVAVAVFGFPPPNRVTSQRVYDSVLLNLPARWDALWYFDIAARGYRWDGSFEHPNNVVFFPGYPIAVRAFSATTRLPVLWSGLIVALAAFFFALVYLHRLARELLDDDAAEGSVALIATYPAAVFFGVPYSESLFLLACVAAFYHFRRRQFIVAAAWGLLAGSTRVPGFLAAVPLAWMAWRDRSHVTDMRTRGRVLIAVAAPVFGLALYSAQLYRLTGHPSLWLENQAGWGQPLYAQIFVGREAEDTSTAIPTTDPTADAIVNTANLASALVTIGAVPLAIRWLGVEYGLFIGACLGPALLGHPFLSMLRFTSVIFPFFIVLARLLGGAGRVRLVASIFFVGQICGAGLFFTWRHFL
ncbi:MAG TPA: mannosyltransferase family protein [Vicinamibacterales bacterium]